jgi:hypothetical protein
MKTFSWSLLILFSSITMISLTGCEGGKKEAASMTEGVEMSEIEAYEQSLREMEAEDAGDMENIETAEPAPAQ